MSGFTWAKTSRMFWFSILKQPCNPLILGKLGEVIKNPYPLNLRMGIVFLYKQIYLSKIEILNPNVAKAGGFQSQGV